MNGSVFIAYPGSQGFESLNMLVNGPRFKIAAARQANYGFAEPPQKRTHQIIGGTKLFDVAVGHRHRF
ncbi:hypothetical protein D3C87_1987100 [compost metagenome]